MSGATLVVGLGHPDRGDDGVGPAVVAALARRRLADGVRLVVQEDPTALLDLWEGHEHVVVVDAVRTGRAPGTLHRLDLGATGPAGAHRECGTGTHALGLAEVVALGRALGRLPVRVVVVGVEAGPLGLGGGLSRPVAAALEDAVALVEAEVDSRVPG